MPTKKNITQKKTNLKPDGAKNQNGQRESLKQQIEVHAKPEDLAGSYSNFAVFKHTNREFIADFVWRIDNTNLLVSRIITSPQQAKAILKALGKNIENYERTYGEIKED
jgi:hypothetical protein